MSVRRLVFSLGYRYRLHDKRLPGKPDLVFAGRRKVIWVHGCFWHGHRGCRYAKLPKTRVDFWSDKVNRNRARDRRNQRQLRKAGWDSLVLWQCELKYVEKLTRTLHDFLESETR